VLPDVVVGEHDDNTSPNTHDFGLAVRGGRMFAALEVTVAVDPGADPVLEDPRRARLAVDRAESRWG
jgi:hypothetical protein